MCTSHLQARVLYAQSVCVRQKKMVTARKDEEEKKRASKKRTHIYIYIHGERERETKKKKRAIECVTNK